MSPWDEALVFEVLEEGVLKGGVVGDRLDLELMNSMWIFCDALLPNALIASKDS
jgi:hypothetical protein